MTTDWRTIPGNNAAFERLVQAVLSGQAIAFVGAGASAGLYPLWAELIRLLASEAVKRGLATKDDEGHWIDPATKPQQAARGIKERLRDAMYFRVLPNIFSPKCGGDGAYFTETHRCIIDLEFRGIVTTN